MSGPIDAVLVTDNEWVKRGTPLFTIDPVPFRLAVEHSQAQEAEAERQLPVDQAEIDALKAQIDAARAAERLAAATLGREVPLGASGTVSGHEIDRSRAMQAESAAQRHSVEAALQKATETLRLHEETVASARATRRLAEWRLSRTRVLASNKTTSLKQGK